MLRADVVNAQQHSSIPEQLLQAFRVLLTSEQELQSLKTEQNTSTHEALTQVDWDEPVTAESEIRVWCALKRIYDSESLCGASGVPTAKMDAAWAVLNHDLQHAMRNYKSGCGKVRVHGLKMIETWLLEHNASSYALDLKLIADM